MRWLGNFAEPEISAHGGLAERKALSAD